MNGNPTWTWISSSDAKTLSATVAFLSERATEESDRQKIIQSACRMSSKSKRTLAIRAGSRGRPIRRPPTLPVALFEKWSILIRLTCPGEG